MNGILLNQGGAGAVESVNGMAGNVELTLGDINDNLVADENKFEYNNQNMQCIKLDTSAGLEISHLTLGTLTMNAEGLTYMNGAYDTSPTADLTFSKSQYDNSTGVVTTTTHKLSEKTDKSETFIHKGLVKNGSYLPKDAKKGDMYQIEEISSLPDNYDFKTWEIQDSGKIGPYENGGPYEDLEAIALQYPENIIEDYNINQSTQIFSFYGAPDQQFQSEFTFELEATGIPSNTGYNNGGYLFFVKDSAEQISINVTYGDITYTNVWDLINFLTTEGHPLYLNINNVKEIHGGKHNATFNAKDYVYYNGETWERISQGPVYDYNNDNNELKLYFNGYTYTLTPQESE